MKKISKMIVCLIVPLVVNVYIAHATPSGWTDDLRLTNAPSHSSEPAIATDSYGIHVVWYDERDGNFEIYYKRSSDGGNTWTGDKRLTNASGTSYFPAVAADRNGIHVVWSDRRDGDSEIYYKKSTDGGNTWTGDRRLTSASGDSLYPTMCTDRNGIHVVWYDERDGNYEIYYKRSSDGGNTWTGDKRLTNDSAYSRWPVIATDSNGVHLVWHHAEPDFLGFYSDYEIFYKRSSDGGNTWTKDIRLINYRPLYEGAAIATDSNGIHIVWPDMRDANYGIYYKRSRDGGNSWTGDVRLAGGTANWPAIVTDCNGIHVAWMDSRDGNPEIYYKKSSDGGNSWTGDKRLTNVSGSSGWPAIATGGSNGIIHVAWMDDRDGNYEIYYKRVTDTTPPTISSLSAFPDPFSPQNSDGIKDTTTISYNVYDDLSGEIVVTIKIYDSGNVLKKTLVEEVFKYRGANSDIWDGKNEAGNVVSDGTYTYRIDAVDQTGNLAKQKSGTVVVDNTSPIISSLSAFPDPFSPDEDGVKDTTTISYTLSENSAVTIKIYDSGNVLKRTLINGLMKSQGANSDIWDGKTDSNIVVPDGAYTYKIDAVDLAGNPAVQQIGTVVVDCLPVVSSLSASPNPFSPDEDGENDRTTISYNLSEESYVTIKIYDSEKAPKRTLINGLFKSRGANSDIWDGKDDTGEVVRNGTYTYKIEAVDPAGHKGIEKQGTVTVQNLVSVANTTPKNNGYLVILPDEEEKIEITFNRHMSTTSMTHENIKITDEDGRYTGFKVVNVSSTTMIIQTNLDYCTKYTVEVSTGVKDFLGNALTEKESFSFTTLIAGSETREVIVEHKGGVVKIDNPSKTFPGGSKGWYINLVKTDIRSLKRRLLCYGVDYSDNPKDIDWLEKPVTISIPYPSDTRDKKNLKLYFYNKDIERWELVKGSGDENPDDGDYYVTGEVRATNTEYCVKGFVAGALVENYSNYPNPFKAGKQETTIIYDLEENAKVTISIYDLLGELVRRIEIPKGTPEKGERGTNRVSWNGKNEKGIVVANGGYYCVIEADTETGEHIRKARKIMVIK